MQQAIIIRNLRPRIARDDDPAPVPPGVGVTPVPGVDEGVPFLPLVFLVGPANEVLRALTRLFI